MMPTALPLGKHTGTRPRVSIPKSIKSLLFAFLGAISPQDLVPQGTERVCICGGIGAQEGRQDAGTGQLGRSDKTASTVVAWLEQQAPPSLNLDPDPPPLSPHTRGEPGATFQPLRWKPGTWKQGGAPQPLRSSPLPATVTDHVASQGAGGDDPGCLFHTPGRNERWGKKESSRVKAEKLALLRRLPSPIWESTRSPPFVLSPGSSGRAAYPPVAPGAHTDARVLPDRNR